MYVTVLLNAIFPPSNITFCVSWWLQKSALNFSLLSVHVFVHISWTCVLVTGRKVLHRRILSLSSCFGKLMRNQFIRLMMGTRPKALVLVGFATYGCVYVMVLLCHVVFKQSNKMYCTLTFLCFVPQTECSSLRKQPVSCTRTLQSLWLFQQWRDTMVCNGNWINETHLVPVHSL